MNLSCRNWNWAGQKLIWRFSGSKSGFRPFYRGTFPLRIQAFTVCTFEKGRMFLSAGTTCSSMGLSSRCVSAEVEEGSLPALRWERCAGSVLGVCICWASAAFLCFDPYDEALRHGHWTSKWALSPSSPFPLHILSTARCEVHSGLLIEHPSVSLPAPSLQLPPAHIEKETVPLRHPNKSEISLSAHLLPSGFFLWCVSRVTWLRVLSSALWFRERNFWGEMSTISIALRFWKMSSWYKLWKKNLLWKAILN